MNANKNDIEELILALQYNEVALWLGQKWQNPELEEEQILLAKQDWYGIWSECQSPITAKIISKYRPEDLKYKYFVEVPEDVADSLQIDFKYSTYCPFFYLNGRSLSTENISSNKRLLSRLQKLAHLERLGPATLLLCGFEAEGIVDFLQNNIDFLGKIECFFITGANETWRSKLESKEDLSLFSGKLICLDESLSEILNKNAGTTQTRGYDLKKHIKARRGKVDISIPVSELLKTNPPIDQYFNIITEHDIRVPTQNENKQELISKFLANQNPCWRAYAHRLQWHRPRSDDLKRELFNKLVKLKKSKSYEVETFDIVGEASSGLSTILQWLAFSAAKEGYPTIIARDTFLPINSDILLDFLSKLDYQLEKENLVNTPVVIVLDRENLKDDSTGDIRRLQRSLKKEARRALLIRGLCDEIEEGSNNSDNAGNEQAAKFAFKKTLDNAEIESLCNWAEQIETGDESKLNTIRKWQAQEVEIPLLVALDYIINDELRETANFHDQLTKRFKLELHNIFDTPGDSSEYSSVPTIKIQGRTLPIMLGSARESAIRPTKQNIVEVLMTVVAMGRLHAMVPLSVLATLTNTHVSILREIVKLLEISKLVKTDMLNRNTRIKPRSYYDGLESIGLLHNLYAYLLQKSLIEENLGQYLKISESWLCKAFIERFSEVGKNDQFPISLLGPVCKALSPGKNEHIEYAELLSTRYLRISYDDIEESGKSKLLREKIDLIIDIYHNDLPAPMLHDSDILLHSFALSCRWSIPLQGLALERKDIEECRQVYEESEKCLKEALELVERRVGSESPENLKTSLGLVYRNRAIVEINHPDGVKGSWKKYMAKAKNCFNDVLSQSQNTYVNHAIADLLIRELEVHFRKEGTEGYESVPKDRLNWFSELKDTDISKRLEEIIKMLADEPEPRFEIKWNSTKKRAFQILVSEDIDYVIKAMKDSRDEMGYILEAMRNLKGILKTTTIIPYNPTADEEEKKCIKQALQKLEEAEDEEIEPSDLGNLLRYALFSALEENNRKFRERYELIKKIKTAEGKLAYNEPVWMYDYAMLAFQNSDVKEGQVFFNQLRKKGLFKKVSFERYNIWQKAPDYKEDVEGELKITRLEQRQQRDRGWGEFISDDHKYRIQEAIPFRIKSFIVQWRSNLEVGKKIRCKIKLQSSGAFAIPSED